MRRLALFAVLTVATLALPAARSQDDKPMKSALETSKAKWEDLPLVEKDWKRLPAIAKGKLAGKDPWKFDKDGIDFAGGGQEMLVYEKLLTNGILHVEWRYPKTAPKGTSLGGLVVRTGKEGETWHQALAGNKAGGYFTGITTIDGKPAKVPSGKQPGPTRVKDAGEWNVYEVTFKDKTLSLFANGYIAAEWPLCQVEKGYVGLRGEGVPIEFKMLKFKRIR